MIKKLFPEAGAIVAFCVLTAAVGLVEVNIPAGVLVCGAILAYMAACVCQKKEKKF